MLMASLILAGALTAPEANPLPPLLVLIIDSVRERVGDEAAALTYQEALIGPKERPAKRRSQMPTGSNQHPDLALSSSPRPSGGKKGSLFDEMGSGPKMAPSSGQDLRARLQANQRKMKDTFTKNVQRTKAQFQENIQRMVAQFNDSVNRMRRRYQGVYARWDSLDGQFDAQKKVFGQNLVDYDFFGKKEKRHRSRQIKEDEREEKYYRERAKKLRRLEEKRQQREEAITQKKQREEEKRQRLKEERKKIREGIAEKERRLKMEHRHERLRRQEEERQKRLEEKRQLELEALRKKEEALRQRQKKYDAQKEEEQKRKQEEEKRTKERKELSQKSMTWRIVDFALEHPIRNQRGRGTCASFATLRTIEIAARQRGLDTDLSEQFFYWASKPECQQAPCQRAGSWPGPGLDHAKIRKLPTEAQCPYVERDMPRNETQIPLNHSCFDEGPVGIEAYEMGETTDDILAWINENRPVVISTKLTRNYYAHRAWIDYRSRNEGNKTDAHAGSHAYIIVGYVQLPEVLKEEEGRYCFVVANSWGEGWGKGGHACISERWLQEFRTINPFLAITDLRL